MLPFNNLIIIMINNNMNYIYNVNISKSTNCNTKNVNPNNEEDDVFFLLFTIRPTTKIKLLFHRICSCLIATVWLSFFCENVE